MDDHIAGDQMRMALRQGAGKVGTAGDLSLRKIKSERSKIRYLNSIDPDVSLIRISGCNSTVAVGRLESITQSTHQGLGYFCRT